MLYVEKSYLRLVWAEKIWSRIIEGKNRDMEAQDSGIKGLSLKILIISPPTGIGLKLLSQANSLGQSHFLCFSSEIEKIAKKYVVRNHIANLEIHQTSFFKPPFVDEYFDAIFVNCFFDFCQKNDLDKVSLDTIIVEIRRVLKNKGALFAVDMGFPSTFISRIWNLAFKIPFIGYGCHPISIKPTLLKYNFNIQKELSITSYGFPIIYIKAIK